MHARTIYEPYAWAIFHGIKFYETLPHPTNIRGRIAIHAAASIPPAAKLHFLTEITKHNLNSGKFSPEWLDTLPRGAVLGSVEIIDCVPVEHIRNGITVLEKAFGDYSDGRYAAVLANPILFARPVPAKGQQGWWNFGGKDDE